MPRSYITQTQALLDLPYDQLCFKASHNTYLRDEPVDEILGFDRDSAYAFGCRGVEFDLHEGRDGFEWSVKHTGNNKGTDLKKFLTGLGTWSAANAGHDPILVTLDLKSLSGDRPGFADRFDRFLENHFDPDCLVKPDEVRPIGVQRVTWPKLGEMAGRFIFCLSGARDDDKFEYAALPGRLCFADRDEGPENLENVHDIAQRYANEPRVFLNCNAGPWIALPQSQGKEYAITLPMPGYVTRVWTVDSPAHWTISKRMGFNVMATDRVQDAWGLFDPPDAYAARFPQ